jgi:hypothetical protein
MNKVYVVLICIPYEGSSIQDIFSTKEKAEECIKSLDLDYGEKAVCIEYKVN